MALIIMLLVASCFTMESVAQIYYLADCSDSPPKTTLGTSTPEPPELDVVRNITTCTSSSLSFEGGLKFHVD
jgi:hypothetical protein